MKYLEFIEIITKIINNLFNLIIAGVKMYVLLYLLFTANAIKSSIESKINNFSIGNIFK